MSLASLRRRRFPNAIELFPLFIAAVFFLAPRPIHAADAGAANSANTLSDMDQTCLGCHGTEGMKKDLANGDTLALYVKPEAFAGSVHRPIGCQACHAEVKLPDHPGNAPKIESARQFTIAQTQTCRSCHDAVFKTYEGSMHAAKLREGNTAAPTCADCHKPHEITAASVQDGARNVCLTCHAGAVDVHQKWLPNAATHLDAIACSACHAPDALRKVDLRLYDTRTRERLVDRSGSFVKLARAADTNSDGLDAGELRQLVAEMNRGDAQVALRGHIELRNGVEAHELPFKPNAIRECTTCHREGMAQFQRVTVSVIAADGKPLRYDAQPDVLSSPMSVDALRGFYAIGGTRIKLLDVVLALVALGAISVPVLHLLVRRWFRRRDHRTGENR